MSNPANYSPWTKFGGFNVKGNPKMTSRQVRHDIKTIAAKVDVAVLQEFEWASYWNVLAHSVYGQFYSYPMPDRGIIKPVRYGQAVMWNQVGHSDGINNGIGPLALSSGGRKQMLLHHGAAGISDDRWLRAALLWHTSRGNDLKAWAGTTHFVVHGDRPHDGAQRKQMLNLDLDHLDAFLRELTATGWPVIFELDANTAWGSPAANRLRHIVESHGGRFYGTKGVEYLFVIDGSGPHADVQVEVRDVWTVPTSQLYTDHEGRCITYRLVSDKEQA